MIRRALCLSVLLGLLVLLLCKGLPGEPSAWIAASVAVDRLDMLETLSNQHALQTPLDLLPNYDALADDLTQVMQARVELHAAAQTLLDLPAWRRLEPIDDLLAQRARLIEDFKSKSAVLRNSLRYLPQLGAALTERALLHGTAAAPLVHQIGEVLRAVLEDYILHDPDATNVEQHLAAAAAALARLPPSVRDDGLPGDLRLLALHVHIVEEQRQATGDLLRALLSLSLKDRLAAMKRELTAHRHRLAQRQAAARASLIILALLPIAWGLWTLRSLRGHTRLLSTANETLEARVAERTQALTGALSAAESASRLKSQFLANMSHEIRTPLNAVIGLTDLCLTTRLTKEQQDNLTLARGAAESLLTLLNDILDLSKIEAGRLVMEAAPFAVRGVIDATVRALATQARSAAVQVEYEVEQAVPEYVLGDSHRLRQVLANLLSNALKFTERGRVAVRVAWRTEEEGAALQVTVTDTGIGIPEDKLALIFEPFLQADGSTTRRFGGSGLGLSIVKELVRMMDGRIEVESRSGEGSSFRFTARLPPAAPPAPPAPSPAPATQRPLRILLVEDNRLNQIVAQRILERTGHQVAVAENGAEGVARYQAGDFDVILMDLQMPVMDGLAATAAIRALELGGPRRIPIIAMTANASTGDRDQCLAQGMDAFLSKPVKAETLHHTLAGYATRPVLT